MKIAPTRFRTAKAPRVRWVAFLAGLLIVAGCATTEAPRDYTPARAQFFLESVDGRGIAVLLPQSGVKIPVNAQPVISEGDIVNVELAQVELGRCLMFQLTPPAARDLYRLTGSHQGRRLVLLVDGAALGARQIDRPISDGNVLVFAEVPDAALPMLVDNLKKTALANQRELARKK
jgi:hypothetical protein